MVDVADRTSVRMSREAGLNDMDPLIHVEKNVPVFVLFIRYPLSLMGSDEALGLRKAEWPSPIPGFCLWQNTLDGGPSGARPARQDKTRYEVQGTS
jgi:hypothetical protein